MHVIDFAMTGNSKVPKFPITSKVTNHEGNLAEVAVDEAANIIFSSALL